MSKGSLETPGRRLTRADLDPKIDAHDIAMVSQAELTRMVTEELGDTGFLPDGVCQTDPRNGDRVIYNSARARRPHDNVTHQEGGEDAGSPGTCIVCDDQVTRTVDVADLSEGFTFINKNLFPILYPKDGQGSPKRGTLEATGQTDGASSHGYHFLQWTSSYHQRDWHNMPQVDRVVAMERLARLEQTLLLSCPAAMPDNAAWGDHSGAHGFVGIIKNYSHLVGGSIAHGHQQIALTNNMPRRMEHNLRFEQRRGERYADYILRHNPSELLVHDYGPAVLLVPYFMRRPYDTQLVLRDTSRRYLHQLDQQELAAVARGWRDSLAAIRAVMPAIGREVAFNVTTHNGPGAGLYFEFLPYTQEMGGYEHLGLIMCQADPEAVAEHLREVVAG